MDYDEIEIVRKIKSGDTEIYSYVIDKYSKYLAKVIHSVYTLNPYDTEDIIAETLISLWKNSKKIDERLNFKSYLAAIARNKTVDFLRKKRLQVIDWDKLDEKLSDKYDVENDIIAKETLNFLKQKIDETKEPDKSILKLKYYHGFSAKEIADNLDLNQNIVNIRLSRQRSKLKKILLRMEVL